MILGTREYLYLSLSLYRNTTLCEVNQCVLESVIHLDLDLDLAPPKLLAAVKVTDYQIK